MKKLMSIVMSALSAVVMGSAFASISVTPENCASVLETMTNGETYEFAAAESASCGHRPRLLRSWPSDSPSDADGQVSSIGREKEKSDTDE